LSQRPNHVGQLQAVLQIKSFNDVLKVSDYLRLVDLKTNFQLIFTMLIPYPLDTTLCDEVCQ